MFLEGGDIQRTQLKTTLTLEQEHEKLCTNRKASLGLNQKTWFCEAAMFLAVGGKN